MNLVSAYLAAALTCCVACAGVQSPAPRGLSVFAKQLEEAILRKDLAYLTSIADREDVMSPSEFAESEIYKFLYDGAWMRMFNPSSRSFEEILKDGVRVVTIPVAMPLGSKLERYYVLFVAEGVPDAKLEKTSFWEREWMQTFASCLVHRTAHGWQMVSSFCHAETEGPGNSGGG